MYLSRCTEWPMTHVPACKGPNSSSTRSRLLLPRVPQTHAASSRLEKPCSSTIAVSRSFQINSSGGSSSSIRAEVQCQVATTTSSNGSSSNSSGASSNVTSTQPDSSIINSSSSGSSSSSSSSMNKAKREGSPVSSLMSMEDLSGAIKGTLDDISTSCKQLDESIDKDYISSVVSLRQCLMDYEWSQHGKQLAERRGVTRFERHCAENDIEVDYKVISMLYNNPYDMSVLGSNNKLKLMARAIIMETVDEHYSSVYAECTTLAKELAKTSFTEIIPESAEKVAGTLRSLIPMPVFLKRLFG